MGGIWLSEEVPVYWICFIVLRSSDGNQSGREGLGERMTMRSMTSLDNSYDDYRDVG